MLNDPEFDVRYHALQMALDMVFLNEDGNEVGPSVPEAIEAAQMFEAFLVGKAA